MKDAEDEAFDELAKRQGHWGGGYQAKKAMAADKLQEPAQKPVAWWNDMGGVIDLNVSGRGKPLYTTPPQPAQEPVAWMYPDDYERMLDNETFCTVYSVEVGSPTRGETTVALYTAPPKRPWVGLTDEERQDIALEVPMDAVFITEAKLKEKNS
jgi:hypothetical protein